MNPQNSLDWNRNEAFLLFVESSQDLVTAVDRQGNFLYVNPTAERILGVPATKCREKSAWDCIHPEDLDRTRTAFEGWAASDANSFRFENRQLSSTGEVLHMQWTVTRQCDAEGRTAYFTSSARDVTKMRTFEQELHRSEVHQRSILAGLLDAVLTIDGVGTILSANKSCNELFRYEPGELVGQNVRILMPEPYHSEHDSYLENYRRTGNTWILGRTREFEVVRKDQSTFVTELSVSRIDVPGSEDPIFSGSFRDVTARRKAERQLAESEQRFRAIFDREFEFVGLLKPDGTTLEANRTVLEVAGVERDSVVGRLFWDTPLWAHSAEAREELQDAVERAAKGEFVRYETEHVGTGGERFVVDFSITPIHDEDGRVVLLIPEGRDITDIKRAQQRETAMMRAFAEIGESASLLAHEIKNPITSVNLALRAVAGKLGEDEQEVLEDLVERMQKLEKLMRRTLSLARPLDVHPVPCNPQHLIESAARTMAPHCEAAQVELVADASEAPQVLADTQLLDDVLTNLIRNAVEALDDGGRIELSAYAEGREVVLAVEDNGPGIPEKILATLFKAFVSTKANGTGLGLAIVRKIVEAHGGSIDVHNSTLGGARFELRLPSA